MTEYGGASNWCRFSQSFEGEREDSALREKLVRELPGILAWAVRGCLEWQRQALREPAAVKAATASYRNEMDTLAAFIEDRCRKSPQTETPSRELYHAYETWAKENGDRILSNKWFGQLLAERGFEATRSRGKRCWKGLTLLDATEEDELPEYSCEIFGSDA